MPAAVSQSQATLQAGVTKPVSMSVGLGRQGDTDADDVVRNGLVRVEAPADNGATVTATATLLTRDGTRRLGPVDLPFALVVPCPVSIEITPDDAPAADIIVRGGASEDPPPHEPQAAKLSRLIAVAGVFELPVGTAWVDLVEPGAWATWRDAAGAAIGTFAGAEGVPPRGAVDLVVSGVSTNVVAYVTA